MQIVWRIATVLGLVLGVCAVSSAEAVHLKAKVENDHTARRQTPIATTLTVGKEISADQVKQIGEHPRAAIDDKQPVQVELVKADDGSVQSVILRWIEAKLDANQMKDCEITFADKSDESKPALHFVDGDGYQDLMNGDKQIYRYEEKFDPAHVKETMKPFHHIYGFHGEGLITKGPGGMETHHRGIFFGFGTQFGNFWDCHDAYQLHKGFIEARKVEGPIAARQSDNIQWVGKDGLIVAHETREVTTWKIAENQLALDYDITVVSESGDLQMSGNVHHSGFHFRAADEVAGPGKQTLHTGGATYIYPDGAKKLKDDEWGDIQWVAAKFSIKDNPYLVIHMSDPANRKATYSTRPYGRFGAGISGVLKSGEPLHLKYRVLIMDGKEHPDETAATLGSYFADFSTPVMVTVSK